MVKSALPYRIVVPLVLGIVVSIAIALYAELGYRRLEVANRQMAVALEMQANLLEMLSLIVNAETGERGYLLTGNEEYLEPYNTAVPKIDNAFHRLREMLVDNGTVAQRDILGRVNALVGKKISELEAAIALYKNDGAQVAQALMDTGIGKRTMDEIRAAIDDMTAAHRRQLDEATNRWSADIEFARIGMQIMTAFTVMLLLLVWLLAGRDTRRREQRRRSAQEENQRLEAIVEERTDALSELSNHLQVVREEEKSKLARDIHDELGGILVSAKMDVAWVAKRLRQRDPEATAKLDRTLEILDDGVQTKRRIIEELRPTLLDNLGLSAALDWQVHEICDRAGIQCRIVVPADDGIIEPRVAIALYRIVQEALTNIVKYARARQVQVDLEAGPDGITLLVTDDGVGIPDDAQSNRLSHGIAGMRQRVRALHGEFWIGRRAEGGTRIQVGLPAPRSPDATAAETPVPGLP